MHNKGHDELQIVEYAAMHLLVCYRLTYLDGKNKKLSQVKNAIQGTILQLIDTSWCTIQWYIHISMLLLLNRYIGSMQLYYYYYWLSMCISVYVGWLIDIWHLSEEPREEQVKSPVWEYFGLTMELLIEIKLFINCASLNKHTVAT